MPEVPTDAWQIVMDNMGLGRNIAKIFNIYDESIVRDITIDTLLRCARSYDSTRRVKFSTYASRALYRAFQRYLRDVKKLYPMPSDAAAETELGILRYNEQQYHKTILESAHFDFIERDNEEAVQFILKGLDEYDQRILLLYYWHGLSTQQLADVLGVVKSTVWKDIQRILTLCRRVARCESDQ